MGENLFALNGVSPFQQVRPFDYGFHYDPIRQVHVLVTHAGLRNVVDVDGAIEAFARTTIDTWCRDPNDYNSKIKDDSDYVNTD